MNYMRERGNKFEGARCVWECVIRRPARRSMHIISRIGVAV